MLWKAILSIPDLRGNMAPTGRPDVIRKEAWPFYRTISGVRLCEELEKPEGHRSFSPRSCQNSGDKEQHLTAPLVRTRQNRRGQRGAYCQITNTTAVRQERRWAEARGP